jgi:hypothetical protein
VEVEEEAASPSANRRPTTTERHAAVARVLDALGPRWRLSAGQRQRLEGPVWSALAAGWPSSALATELAANPEGVRAPYAVLRSRLAELVETPPQEPAKSLRPPHCGSCVEATRYRELDDGRPYPCPLCHPVPARRAAGAEIEATESAVEARTGAPEGHPLRLISTNAVV